MLNSITNLFKDQGYDISISNIGKSERIVSVGTGLVITISGMARLFTNPLLAITEIGVGAMLLDRGISGHCFVKGLANNRNEDKQPTGVVPLSTAETNIQSTVLDAIDLGSGTPLN